MLISSSFRRVGRAIIVVIVAVSIVVPLFSYWADVRVALIHLRLNHLAVGLICMTVSFVWLAWCWYRMAKLGGFKPGAREAIRIYTRTALIRYIPGSVFGLAAKALMMRRWGIQPQQALYLMAYESGVLLWSGMVTFFFVSWVIPETEVVRWLIGILCLVVAPFLFYPLRFVKVLHWIRPTLSVSIVPDQSRMMTITTYLGYWVLAGTSFAFLITAAGDDMSYHLVQSIGIFALSWVIGFLVLITPSGVGIREWCMVLLLQQSIPIATAITVAFVARIIFIFGELITYGLSSLIALYTHADVQTHDKP